MQKNRSQPMKFYKAIRFFVPFSIAVLFPLVINYWLQAKYKDSKILISKYECLSQQCNGDFNGDGVKDKVLIYHSFFNTGRESNIENGVAVVIENGKVVLSLPYTYIDDTFRTHIALYNDQNKTLFIVFDGTNKQDIPREQVLEWDGEKFSQFPISGVARDIIWALKWHDDAGYWNIWSYYRLFFPWFFGIYTILVLVVLLRKYFA